MGCAEEAIMPSMPPKEMEYSFISSPCFCVRKACVFDMTGAMWQPK